MGNSEHGLWSDRGLGKLWMSHFKSQQNIIGAFVRISLFILMKCREVFLSLSHIPPVTKQRGLEENFLSVNCSNMWSLKTTRVLKNTNPEYFCSFLKYRKGSVVVWPLDFLTCLFMKSFDYFEISQHCSLSFPNLKWWLLHKMVRGAVQIISHK